MTLRHTTLGRTPLDEGSVRLRETSTSHSTQLSQETDNPCPRAGFVPAIPGGEQPQTHALDRIATGIGTN